MISRFFSIQKGFTLIELMISVSIGIAMTGVTLKIFIDNKQMARVIEANSRIQENGRFALEFLMNDVRQAGGMDNCNNNTIIVDHLNDSSYSYFETSNILSGSDGAEDSLTLISTNSGSGFTVNLNGVLSVTQPAPPAAQLAISCGDTLLVGDCSSAHVIQNASNSFASNQIVTMNGSINCGGISYTGNNINNLSAYSALFPAQVFKISKITKKYEIGPVDVNSNGTIEDDECAANTLCLTTTESGSVETEELVEGIENMQILYGVDTGTDNIPNYYVNATIVDSLADGWTNVKTVRISLLAVSLESGITLNNQYYWYDHDGDGDVTKQVNTADDDNDSDNDDGADDNDTDRKLRRVFSTTIQLRNRVL